MKSLLAIIFIIGSSFPLFSQEVFKKNDFELSTGTSMMLYQSVYSFQQSVAWETAIRGNVSRQWDWQLGARMGIDPVLPDFFARFLAAPELGFWRPFVGVEFGYTNRAHFEAGEKLLRETRTAMEKNISHFYIAGHSAPLSFNVWEKYRISLLELHIGTHLGHSGRTLRVQLGVISIGRRL